jgi:Fe-S cluster biosynthesis and repair protein YggX
MRLPETRNQERAANLRARRERLIWLADQAEKITEAVETWCWKEWIKPALQAQIRGFSENVLSMPKEDFEKRQYLAQGFQEFLDEAESLVGGKERLLADASKIQEQLEAAERDGLIPREIDDDAAR